MKKLSLSLRIACLMGAAMTVLFGCPIKPDDLPPDTPGVSGSSSSGGMAASCGNGKLDMGEACDDGNATAADGCTQCEVDECFTCTAEAEQASTCVPKAEKEPCESTRFCDGKGACVECIEDAQCSGGYCYMNVCASCMDTVQNGDETDADCGGAHCPTCGNGKKCNANEDCVSTFCTDGLCCDTICDGACTACNIAGFLGECSVMDKFAEDPSYGMGMSCLHADGKACTAGGSCAKALEQPCTSNAECASTRCGDPDGDLKKTCVGAPGDPCSQPADCYSNNCMNNVCM